MIKWVFLTLVIGFFSLAVYLYFHLGLNQSPEVIGIQTKEFHFLGQRLIGPYHQMNNTIKEVELWALKNNIPCTETFGLYIDDPKSSAEDRLRSDGGCVLTTSLSNIKSLDKLKYIHLPQHRYLVVNFSGSPAIGPFKVYPEVHKWLQTHKQQQDGPVIEIYRIAGPQLLTTTYYFPLR